MAIVKCLDCGKMISDLAPACIGCGRPMTPVSGASSAAPSTASGITSPITAPSEEPRRTSVPTPLSPEEESRDVPEGTARPPSDLPKKKIIAHKIIPPPPEPKKRFTATKTFTMAFLLTGILSVVAGAFALSQGRHVSKNPIWTFAWMYLSVEAWRSWGWKALLPYPISVAATVLIGGLLFVSGVELMSWPYVIVIGVCNLGGLILFNLLLQKSKAAYSERDFRYRNKETSQDTRAPFWPVALVALIIGGIFYGVYVSNRPTPSTVHQSNLDPSTFIPDKPAPPAVNQAASQPIPAPSTIRRDDPPPDPADVVWDKPVATPASQAGAKQDKYRRIAAGDLSALPDKYRRIAAGDDYIDPAEVEIDGSFIDPAEVQIDSKPAAGNAGRVTSGGGGGVQVSPEAQNTQGQAYYEAQNFAEAVKWWRMAAENGYARAQTNLGISYVTGKGVPKNAAEAAKWYRLAAIQGNAQAQYNLGVMYDDGDGVPQDTTEAVRLFRKAAEQGNVNAQFNLGMMFDNGKGIAKNRAEAVKWYRMAAAQGDTDAQRNLNVLLSR